MSAWTEDFVARLAGIRMTAVFNPYTDRCGIHDLPDAARIRRENLLAMLGNGCAAGVEAIWFGRDLGYRGGRRTGLALTDELNMLDVRNHPGRRAAATKATVGDVVAERTAAVIWSVIRRLPEPPLLWNAFPLHPHYPDAPLSNRAHSAVERRATAWTIETLIARYDRPRLVAIGNDASRALSQLGFEHEVVRHPSYGGQREFVEGMERLHGLPHVQEAAPALLL